MFIQPNPQVDKALTRFQLGRTTEDKWSGKIWYKYHCRGSMDYGPLINTKPMQPLKTQYYDTTLVEDWWVRNLDYHNDLMKDPCGGNDRIIADFWLYGDKSSSKYYVACRKSPYKLHCLKKSTELVTYDGYAYQFVQSLAYHNVDCKNGFIKGFIFDKNNYPKTRFEYECCGPFWMNPTELSEHLGIPARDWGDSLL